jgi:teichuronic acid biosynthesis glycosyltransferase TuaH
MTQGKTTHVIIGGHEYEHNIPHREHRLANYLFERSSTNKIVWISIGSEFKLNNKGSKRFLEMKVPALHMAARIPLKFINRFGFDLYNERRIEPNITNQLGQNNILWYYSPYLTFLSNRDSLWNMIVYDCSDNHTTTGWKYEHNKRVDELLKDRLLAHFRQWSENEILENVDTVFASSEYLYEKLDRHTDAPIYLEETGVDFDKFRTNNKYSRVEEINPPRLGFVGKLKRKIDYEVLAELAEENPSWSLVIVGPKTGVDIDYLLNIPNVTWIKAVDPDEVPMVMNSLDVGLMPYRDIEYNKAVFPLKFYEYLASGLPVVGCGLPSTEQYTQEGVYLHTSNNLSDFSNACSQVLSWENNAETRKTIAAQADWSSKFDRMYKYVSKINGSRSNSNSD